MKTSLTDRILTQLLTHLDLKGLNVARQKLVQDGKEPNQNNQIELENEVHQIHESKQKHLTSENIIRTNWLRFRAGCWRCLSFDHFGLGSSDRIEGQHKRSKYVPKRFMEYIIAFLFVRDSGNEEIQLKRTALINGIIKTVFVFRILTITIYACIAEYKDMLVHLRDLRNRQGDKVIKYLKNDPGNTSKKGRVVKADRQRDRKTYKGAMVVMNTIKKDPHKSFQVTGNLSDVKPNERVDALLDEINRLPMPGTTLYCRSDNIQGLQVPSTYTSPDGMNNGSLNNGSFNRHLVPLYDESDKPYSNSGVGFNHQRQPFYNESDKHNSNSGVFFNHQRQQFYNESDQTYSNSGVGFNHQGQLLGDGRGYQYSGDTSIGNSGTHSEQRYYSDGRGTNSGTNRVFTCQPYGKLGLNTSCNKLF